MAALGLRLHEGAVQDLDGVRGVVEPGGQALADVVVEHTLVQDRDHPPGHDPQERTARSERSAAFTASSTKEREERCSGLKRVCSCVTRSSLRSASSVVCVPRLATSAIQAVRESSRRARERSRSTVAIES